MSTPTVQTITALHDEYVRLTGMNVSLFGREHAWYEWVRRELGVPELRLLVAEKRRRIKAGELPPASLTFRNLVANVDYAEEDIAELRARGRTRKLDPNKASLLRQTGRPDAPRPAETQSAAQVITKLQSDPAAAAKALEELRALKNNL
jgi:hypothetical protein